MTGFTFCYKGKDIFVKTEKKRKTESLASKIMRKMMLPENPSTRKELLHYLQKATCEIRTSLNGKQYYEISGDGFGGRGSFVDDGNTIILEVN